MIFSGLLAGLSLNAQAQLCRDVEAAVKWMNTAVGLQTLLQVGDTTLAEREPGQLLAHVQLTLGSSKRQFHPNLEP